MAPRNRAARRLVLSAVIALPGEIAAHTRHGHALAHRPSRPSHDGGPASGERRRLHNRMEWMSRLLHASTVVTTIRPSVDADALIQIKRSRLLRPFYAAIAFDYSHERRTVRIRVQKRASPWDKLFCLTYSPMSIPILSFQRSLNESFRKSLP